MCLVFPSSSRTRFLALAVVSIWRLQMPWKAEMGENKVSPFRKTLPTLVSIFFLLSCRGAICYTEKHLKNHAWPSVDMGKFLSTFSSWEIRKENQWVMTSCDFLQNPFISVHCQLHGAQDWEAFNNPASDHRRSLHIMITLYIMLGRGAFEPHLTVPGLIPGSVLREPYLVLGIEPVSSTYKVTPPVLFPKPHLHSRYSFWLFG